MVAMGKLCNSHEKECEVEFLNNIHIIYLQFSAKHILNNVILVFSYISHSLVIEKRQTLLTECE